MAASSATTTPTTTTTTTTPTVQPVTLPIDSTGKAATVIEQQLRSLGFAAVRFLDPVGKQVVVDPSWTVVSVDGAGGSYRPDTVVIVRVDKPAPLPPAPELPVPEPVEEPPPAAEYYANCSAARAAGAAPLHRGDPGYRAALDRDKDGVACE
jgi:hypothetical protein